MKIKNFHAASDPALKRQFLDRWHTFNNVSDQTYLSSGQNVLQGVQWVDAVTTVSITVGGALSTAGNATLVALATNDLLQVNGVIYALATASIPAGTAAGALGTVNPAPAVAVVAAPGTAAQKLVLQGLEYQTTRCNKTLNSLTIKAHGISIYDNFPSSFFNAYTAYHYGGPNINVPEDCGACFVPFCLYPSQKI